MRLLESLLSLSLLAAIGCTAESTTHDVTQAAGPALPTCTPQPPINPLLCNPEEPAPPPPPINGKCTIELRVDEVGFSAGQGWFENRAEASAKFTATNTDTGDTVSGSYPSSGTIKMDIGTTHTTSVGLGTYVVNQSDTLDVEVCAAFSEADGGLNKDDIGFDCDTITLHCPEPGGDFPLRADLCKGGDCTNKNGAMSANVNVMTADADRDCVENEDDYTPEPCDEAFKGQLCRAALVYFHYGDGVMNDLAQNLGTNLVPEMTGYDRVVLLIDDDQVGPYNLNPAALALADVKMLPTEENYFAALQDLTSRGCDIDVYNHSHGSPEWQTQTDNSVISVGGSITAMADDDISADPDITTTELLEDTNVANSGTASVPVRMTYGTPCFYSFWNLAWTTVGAKVTGGSADINFTPLFAERFANNWNAGQTYGAAVAGEFTVAAENLAFGFIALEGAAPPWLCVGNTVLGQNPCARNFFTDIDLMPAADPITGDWVDGPDEAKYGIGGPRDNTVGVTYDATQTGAQNMRRSSRKINVGNLGVRKFVPATLTWP